jgi:hypothetical protein
MKVLKIVRDVILHAARKSDERSQNWIGIRFAQVVPIDLSRHVLALEVLS